jgi:16S rRNA processing protein RimM
MKVLEGQGSEGAWRECKEVYIGSDIDSANRYQVKHNRGSGKYAILALEGIGTPEEVGILKGKHLYVPRDMLPELEEGTYYVSDLLGMKVEDTQSRLLGVLKEIFDNGAHDVYVVRNKSAELLIPVIDGVLVEIDTNAGRIVVDPPDGIL